MAVSLSAIGQVASLDSLRAAWLEINRRSHGASRRTVGVDGQSIETFASNLERNLVSARNGLLSDNGYVFSPLRARFIPKPSGKERVICIPTVADRVVQRSISNYLAEDDRCRLANSVSYGFIKNRSVKKAVRRACLLRKNKRWAYKTDITAFFDQIGRDRLKHEITSKVRAKTIRSTLMRAVDAEIQEPSRERQKKLHKLGIKEGIGVRQGMPLSPFFANLILRDFDSAIERYKITMVRYADDLIILAGSEYNCLKVHKLCKDLLNKIGLDIPEPAGEQDMESKTKIYSPRKPAEFLGVGIKRAGEKRYEPYVLSNQMTEIRSRILAISSIDECRKRGFTLSRLLQRLDDSHGGYEQAYRHCLNSGQVAKVCKDARNEVIRRVFEELGIDFDNLTFEHRAFLGLG